MNCKQSKIGLIPNEAELIELGELLELVIDHRGKTPKKIGGDWVADGIPAISAKNIHNGILTNQDSIRFVEKNVYQKWMNEDVKRGDVFIVSEGATMGEYLYWDNDYPIVLSQRLFCLRPKKNRLNSKYLYAFVRSRGFQEQMKGMATGSSVLGVRQSALLKILIPIIKIEKQQIIGDFIYNLEEKIHLNQQTNETLEAMAQAIFKSWFVDFDPVRAKIKAASVGRDPNRAAMASIAGVKLDRDWDKIEAALDQKLGRMTDEQRQQLSRTAELFPYELVESEVGVVPKEWDIKPFYDTIEIIGGGTPKTKIDEYWGGDILWYSVVDAPNESDVFVIDTDKKITETGLENSSAKLVDSGTTIISARGTVGKLALTPKPMTYNQSCYGLRSKNECPYFNFFKTKQLVESLKRGSHGSVFDTITQKTFKTIDIAQPPENLEIRFDKVVGGIMSKIQMNLEENSILTQLRDTLLPKLISGEIQ